MARIPVKGEKTKTAVCALDDPDWRARRNYRSKPQARGWGHSVEQKREYPKDALETGSSAGGGRKRQKRTKNQLLCSMGSI